MTPFCQVKAIWDISTPFRASISGVTWKDIKTLQQRMPDIHESLMVSIFAPTMWKSGWLNDAVCRLSKTVTFKTFKLGVLLANVTGNIILFYFITIGYQCLSCSPGKMGQQKCK